MLNFASMLSATRKSATATKPNPQAWTLSLMDHAHCSLLSLKADTTWRDFHIPHRIAAESGLRSRIRNA
jgi:hypothetical protein